MKRRGVSLRLRGRRSCCECSGGLQTDVSAVIRVRAPVTDEMVHEIREELIEDRLAGWDGDADVRDGELEGVPDGGIVGGPVGVLAADAVVDAEEADDGSEERQRALCETLLHAKTNSPWHASRLGRVDPATFTEADLQALPVMTKTDVMTNWDAIVTDRRLTLADCNAHIAAKCIDPA